MKKKIIELTEKISFGKMMKAAIKPNKKIKKTDYFVDEINGYTTTYQAPCVFPVNQSEHH